MPLIRSGVPERPSTDLETALGRDVGVSSPKNDGDEIASMIVKESLVVRANPMMDSHGEAKQNERPPIQVRTFRLSERLPPANLEGPEWSINLRVWLHFLFPVKTADRKGCRGIIAIGVPNFLFWTAGLDGTYVPEDRANPRLCAEDQCSTHYLSGQQR